MTRKFRSVKDDGDTVVTKRELHRMLAEFARLADQAMERRVVGLLHSFRETPYDMDTREGTPSSGQHDPRTDQLQAVSQESGGEALSGEDNPNVSASREGGEQEDSYASV